jgi:NADH dehydrogenase
MILVTGGTGHLGAHLIPLLTAGGSHVRVLTRNKDRARIRLGGGPELVEGDVRSPDSLRMAVDGVESVVSAVTGFGPGGQGTREVDDDGNRNLIRAAEQAGVHRFVLLSMRGASADHPMKLARMKHRAEQTLRATRLSWTILRPTPFMELWAGIVGDPIVKTGKTTVFGRGDNPINFIAERDLARMIQLALVEPRFDHAVLDVGGPGNVSFNQLVRKLEGAIGRTAAVRHVPVPMMRLAALLTRPLRPDVSGMIEAGIGFETGDLRFDPSDLRRLFPPIELTSVADVIESRFGVPAASAVTHSVGDEVQN